MKTLKQLKHDCSTLKTLIYVKEMYGSLRQFVKIWSAYVGRIDLDDYIDGEILVNGTEYNHYEVYKMETAFYCLERRGLA